MIWNVNYPLWKSQNYRKIGFHDMLTELEEYLYYWFQNEEEFEIYLGRDQTG